MAWICPKHGVVTVVSFAEKGYACCKDVREEEGVGEYRACREICEAEEEEEDWWTRWLRKNWGGER